MLTRRHLIATAGACALAPGLAGGARADDWPNHALHMIVPLAAGGPTDTNARLLAEGLTNTLGQQVVIDNKGGAGTNIGNGFVAHSAPDGYTLLYATSSLAVNTALYRGLDYDPVTDLAPVSLVAKFPFFVFVPNSSPAHTLAEFIAYAKTRDGKLVIGSPGTGSGPHLAELLFARMAGIRLTHAPYRGAAPAFVDLIPGRIDCYFGSGELLTYSRSGQVRVLASTGAQRSPAAPDVPTVAEAGVTGYAVESWQGVFAPGKTPPEIVRKLNAGVVKALADAALVAKLAQAAYSAAPCSPDELASFLKTDSAKWSAVIKAENLSLD